MDREKHEQDTGALVPVSAASGAAPDSQNQPSAVSGEAGNLESLQDSNLRQIMGEIMADFMRPIMETIGELLKNNTAALEQIAQAQAVQADRLGSLERDLRLRCHISNKQFAYLCAAVKAHARALLDKYELADDAKAVRKLGEAIKRDVLARYGIGSMREIPEHEYSVARSQIDMWRDALTIRDIVKEARDRAHEAVGGAEQVAGADGH